MTSICARCGDKFETAPEHPARWCPRCESVAASPQGDPSLPASAVSERPTAGPRYLDDRYGDFDPEQLTLRSTPTEEDQRLANSGGNGLFWGGWIVVFSVAIINGLGYLNVRELVDLGQNPLGGGVARDAVLSVMLVGVGCLTVGSLLPAIFMMVGGSCLKRFSSRGLVVTGAIFSFLIAAWHGLTLGLAMVSIAIGGEDLQAITGSPSVLVRTIILHSIEAITAIFWIFVGVRALRIVNRPSIASLFQAKMYERNRRF